MRIKFNTFLIALLVTSFCGLSFSNKAFAQNNDSDSTFKPHGKLSGYAFGDYYYKGHSDSLNRGGANQYTKVPAGQNAFQFRRVYLGYDYEISPKFSAQVLLAAEDASDALGSGKYAFYVKLANIRWKNILPRMDLVIGQVATPAFAMTSEPAWSYRSIERTIADIRRVPSYDLGATIQGKFDAKGNYGYDIMVGNGTGAKPENDKFKHFYGDVYAKFLDQKLMVDLYGDYERVNWTSTFHHSRSMGKIYVGYTTPKLTVGAEAFITGLQSDVIALNNKTSVMDTLNGTAAGLSVFVRGPIIKDKLGFFARMDNYNPNTQYDNTSYSKYTGLTSNYEPNNKEQFITAGLDFTPVKNVHLMPNIWYNSYSNQGANGSMKDYDMVYRLTFYFIYK